MDHSEMPGRPGRSWAWVALPFAALAFRAVRRQRRTQRRMMLRMERGMRHGHMRAGRHF